MIASDTIVALSTPAGRGGLGVVRLSGPAARAIAEGLLGRELGERRAQWAEFRDVGGALLDEVVATYFAGPRSATGEDVVEIAAHGAPVLLAALVDGARGRGARPAEPGEFTRRAFLSGRLDLAQAEAVGDLIAAQTLFQARTAARQMQGSVARLLRPAHGQLTELIARLEAGIDFADDDVAVLDPGPAAAALAAVGAALARLQAGFAAARVIREGLTVALVGRPNVGKSSLFNRLLGRERAIVTAWPGTTRDLLEAPLDWDGIPVRLLDTAGVREAHGPEAEPERLGIAKTWEAAADADLVLAVFDLSQPPAPEDAGLRRRLADLPRAVVVWNKSDLERAAGAAPPPAGELVVSALTGEGIAELRAAIRARCLPELAGEAGELTNVRHAHQIELAQRHLERAAAALPAMPHEAVLVDLYEALHALDAITGQTTVEDILGVIFSTFCVGK